MPIRPENKKRYPKDWKEIRTKILRRARNRCEQCGAPNHEYVERGNGFYMLEDGRAFDADNGKYLGYLRGSEFCGRPVMIILTIAHLDHTPENCNPKNLRALCQRCHNRYDAPMRARGRKHRRREALGCEELFK